MAVLEHVAERLLRSSFVDLGTGTLETNLTLDPLSLMRYLYLISPYNIPTESHI